MLEVVEGVGEVHAYRYMRSMLAMSGSSPVSAIAWSGYGSGSGCSWVLVVVTFFATLWTGGILYATVAVYRDKTEKEKRKKEMPLFSRQTNPLFHKSSAIDPN